MSNIILRTSRPLYYLIGFFSIVFSVFHLYTGLTGTFESLIQRTFHVFLGLIILFLVVAHKQEKFIWRLVYFLGSLTTLVFAILFYMNYEHFRTRLPLATQMTILEIIGCVCIMLFVLEGIRRITGGFLALLTILFLIYPFVGPYLPGILKNGGFRLDYLMDGTMLSEQGLLGTPIGASATFIALFIIFGSVLEKSGIGELIMDVSTGIFGRYRGGPAKAAVVSSGLFGSIDGNATSDVMITGSVNIPLMKKIGYSADFAAAVEAAAATGGVLLPPVMGTVAFIMAQYTGVPYSQIIWYALIPALLYYVGIFSIVHFTSIKLNFKGLNKEDLPDWKGALKRKWHLLLPVVLLVVLIIKHYSPAYAVTYSIISIIVIANLRKHTRMGFKAIVEALINGAKGSSLVIMATAAAGIITYSFAVTGLGLRFVESVVSMAGGNLFLALFLTMLTTIVLGMGVPPASAYIIQAAITIPPVIKLLNAAHYSGDTTIAAHMFVMYFSAMALITPPVAIAAYAAAGIANSSPLKTSVIASKLAFSAFLVPFIFAFNPHLLMMGSGIQISTAFITTFFGIIGFSAVMVGYFRYKLSIIPRLILLIASILLVLPNVVFNVIGLILLVGMYFIRNKELGVSAIEI